MKKGSGAYSYIINQHSFLFTLIIIFILVFGAASIIAYKHYKSALLYAIAENKSTASFLSTLIYEHQKAAIGILESYVQHPLFIDVVKVKDFNNLIPHLQSLSKTHTEIDALFITDQYGTVLADYPVSGESYGKNLAYRDWYKGVSKKWRPYISTVFRRIVLEKGLAVAVSVPVFDRKGKVIGILGSAQRTSFLATLIRANTLNPRKKITLLDQEGNIIYVDTVDYEKEITKYLHFSPIQEAIRNGKNILDIPDPVRRRKEDLLAFSPIRDTGWTVIVSEEKGAILRSETTYFIEIFAIAFFLFVCMTIAPLLLRRDYQYRETKGLLTQEKKLRESEERYRNLVESISDVVFAIDSSGVLTYISPVVKNTLGYEPDELIGRQFLEFVHKEDHDLLMRRFSELREGIVRQDEYRVIGKHGDIKWMRTLTNPIVEEGGFVGARGVLIDITERRKAEEALRASEENFRVVVENASDAILVEAGEGSHVYANQQAAEITGYCVAELLKTTIKDLAHPDEFEKIMQIYRRRLEGEPVPRLYETTIIRKDGKSVPIEVAGTKTVWQGKTADMVFFRDITERKKAEIALRRERDRAKQYLDMAGTMLLALDAEEKVTLVNKRGCEILGYRDEEILGKPWIDNFLPEMIREEVRGVFHRLMAGEVEPLEYYKPVPVLCKGGVEKFIAFHNAVLSDERGEIIGILSSGEDITERKRAEAQTEYQAHLLANVQDAIIATDEQLVVTAWNRAAEEIYGWKAEEVLGRNVFAFLGSESTEAQRAAAIRTMAETGRNRVEEVVHHRRDGEPIHMEATVTALGGADGRVTGYVNVLRDITERKRMEEVLKKSIKLLNDTGEMAKVGGWELDLSTKEALMTDEVCRIHGVEPGYKPKLEEAIKFYAPESIPALEATLKKTIETGEPCDLESLFIPSGSKDKIWVRSLGRAIYSGGKIVKLAGTFQNIDKYKRAEAERERLLAELEAKNKELEAFVYTISHDLKAPLVSLNGFSSVLQKEYESQLGEEGKHYLERIQANVAHMEVLIESLLELSRIGQVVGSIEEIDVAAATEGDPGCAGGQAKGGRGGVCGAGAAAHRPRRPRPYVPGVRQSDRKRGQIQERGKSAAHRGRLPAGERFLSLPRGR